MNKKEIRLIIALLDNFFNDSNKTNAWLRIGNPLLGNLRPWDMIEAGREKKLLKFIKNQLDENVLR